MTEPRSQDYLDGFKAGHEKGVADGIGIGYSDCKRRAYLAVDVLSASPYGWSRSHLRCVNNELKAMIGGRS